MARLNGVLRALGFQDFGDGSMALDAPNASIGALQAALGEHSLYADQIDIGDVTLPADQIEEALDA